MMRPPRALRKATALLLLLPAAAAAQARPAPPTADYWVYVGAESADVLHRIRFGPGGAVIEKTIPVGELAAEMEGPHGLQVSRDGRFLHMTTGHGFPDGKFWTFHLGPDTLVAAPTLLGNFPASLDVSPDGLYALVANFNLHGDMVPSSQSVVYIPEHVEVARVVTCTMPHGSRFEPAGRYQYSGCMMDDQLVEIDTRDFRVSRRFSLARGAEGPLPADDRGRHAAGGPADHAAHGDHAGPVPARGSARPGPEVDPADVGYQGMRHAMTPQTCSPTWAQPSADGAHVYVACNKADELVEVERAGWRVTRRWATGRGPYNVAVTPDGRLVLVTLKQGAGFEVFDRATGRSLARFASSTTVTHGVAVSPDARYAFVSSEGVGAAPGKVDIYDLQALARVGAVDTAQQAGGITFWRMAAR